MSVIIAISVLAACSQRAEGDRQMRELCAKDGGVKVYERVRIARGQLDPEGKPRARDAARNTDGSFKGNEIDPAYRESVVDTILRSGEPSRGELKLIRVHRRIYRNSDGKLLGESVSYIRIGGDPWFQRILGHPSGNSCPERYFLMQSIFIPEE